MDTIDVTAVEGLERLITGYREGYRVKLTQAKLPVRERLSRADWAEGCGEDVVHPAIRDALRETGC